jgi:hypothetical protein
LLGSRTRNDVAEIPAPPAPVKTWVSKFCVTEAMELEVDESMIRVTVLVSGAMVVLRAGIEISASMHSGLYASAPMSRMAELVDELAEAGRAQVFTNPASFMLRGIIVLLSYMSTKNEDDNEPSTELIKQVLSFNEDLNALQSKIKITIRNVKYIRKSIKGMLEKS